MGCDPSYLNILYRGYSACHADENGNPPAKPVPPSDKMSVKVREFLAKAADAKLKELATKYPPRGLAVASKPEPKASKPKRKTARKAAKKGKRQALPESQPVAEAAKAAD